MIKVIIVEDERIIRRGLMYSFDWGSLDCIVVGEAENGLEALTKINELQPDLIILDLNMPIMGGIDLLERIQHLQIKVIIISGHDEFEYAKKAIHYNVYEYLLKPVDLNELKKAIIKVKDDLKTDLTLSNLLNNSEQYLVLPNDYVNDHMLLELHQYLEDNYAYKILLEDVVDHLGVSSSCINLKLRKSYNLTFNKYLNHFRIHKAMMLIKDSNFPIYEISIQCGFSEYKYFSQVFKKYVGISPTKLKENLNVK